MHTIRRPPAPVGPSHLRTRWCGVSCNIIMCAIIMCVHIRSLLSLPLLLPIHPLHPVTSSHTPHLSRRFASWPLTPPPRSDSFRSTVHNVQTPCRPLRTRQGGRVRGLECLSCHMHTIRRPPAPVGPSHLRTRWCGVSCNIIMCAIIMCVHIRSLLPLPLLLPIHPLHPVTSSHTPHLSRRFVSWPLTPPPRSDSFRSTVHNVQTPCRPLRTRQGGRVRGLQCLSCHMHTIRHPPAPVGPSHLRTRWWEFRATLLCVPL